MAEIKKDIDRGIELLWLCQSLQSEKDGVDRPSHFQIDKSKTLDSFAQDVSRAVTNMSCLYQMIPQIERLSAVGRELERKGLIELVAGDSHSDAALAYLESISRKDGDLWIGEGFNSQGSGKKQAKRPDRNGKLYSRFYLIESGVNQGMYAPIHVSKRSELKDEVLEREMRDIRESGFEILIDEFSRFSSKNK